MAFQGINDFKAFATPQFAIGVCPEGDGVYAGLNSSLDQKKRRLEAPAPRTEMQRSAQLEFEREPRLT
jgi:hypothetical protein